MNQLVNSPKPTETAKVLTPSEIDSLRQDKQNTYAKVEAYLDKVPLKLSI